MTELTYIQNGDYLLPNLVVPEKTPPLGMYGRMRRKYLMEHQPAMLNRLVVTGKLFLHLTEIDRIAQERFDRMMPILMQQNNVTESLKASDPMKWVGMMNNLRHQIEETILDELVYN